MCYIKDSTRSDDKEGTVILSNGMNELKGRAARPSQGLPAPAATILARADLDVLFHAVQARIVQTLGENFAARCLARGGDPASLIRATVLECVADMEQRHSMVSHEVGDRRRLEQDICDLEGRLSRLQAELSGRQASEIEARHWA